MECFLTVRVNLKYGLNRNMNSFIVGSVPCMSIRSRQSTVFFRSIFLLLFLSVQKCVKVTLWL